MFCGYYDEGQISCTHDRTTYEYEYDTSTYHYSIEHCRDCGEKLNSYRERHSLEEDCTYYNSSYHTNESYCPDCDTVIDSQREAHSWSCDYSPYNSSQHRVDKTCYDCGYDTGDYESHNWGTATYTSSGSSLYSSVSVTSAKTFYAQFTPATYTITWNLGDGKTETTQQPYGEPLTLPADPVTDEYTF